VEVSAVVEGSACGIGAASLVVVVVVAVPLTAEPLLEGFCWQAVTLMKHKPAIAAAIMCFCMMFFLFIQLIEYKIK